MASSSKKRQTMAKVTRELALKQRRAQKQEKKDEKKLARIAEAAGDIVSEEDEAVDGEVPGD